MKIKELKSLKTKDLKELEKLLSGKKLELMKLQVKIAGAKEKNVKIIRNLKKEIAQILTFIQENKLSNKNGVVPAKNERKEK